MKLKKAYLLNIYICLVKRNMKQFLLGTKNRHYLILPLVIGSWETSNLLLKFVKHWLRLYVTSATLPGFGNTVLPAHAAIYDSTGKGIVVEFVGGKMYVYDNIGVMTNSPTYNWQVTNLRNYLNLSPYAPNPVTVNGITFAATGQGSA